METPLVVLTSYPCLFEQSLEGEFHKIVYVQHEGDLDKRHDHMVWAVFLFLNTQYSLQNYKQSGKKDTPHIQ